MFDKSFFKIRPSQVTRTFGPGAIYDNQRDSVIILGLEFWKDEKFDSIRDRLLLREIKKENKFFERVNKLVSVSSFKDSEDKPEIPVRSFPTWGVCPECHKLQEGRNYGKNRGVKCDSKECADAKKNSGKDIPKTNPVRYVSVCINGHLDDFPWYEWVHRTEQERKICGRRDAILYFEEDPSKISIESSSVKCKNPQCKTTKRNMRFALTEKGLLSARPGCTRRRPWLQTKAESCKDEDGNPVNMRGMFKGSTSMYFPITRSVLTIPPFSDSLALKIDEKREDIVKHKGKPYFQGWLETEFDVKTDENPDGEWTNEEVEKKIALLDRFDEDKKDIDIFSLEFEALNNGSKINDDEFVTDVINDIEEPFKNILERVTLVKKIRVISAITGFTRIESMDGTNNIKISNISKELPEWLPTMENRGEAIFLSFKEKTIKDWEGRDDVKKRVQEILTVQEKSIQEGSEHRHSARYFLLHSLSHSIIKSLSETVGYNAATLSERIYCDDGMAGILIYTSSPSSDGSLGGLVEIGRQDGGRLWGILENAVQNSETCPYDPLCSTQEPRKIPHPNGSACQGCLMLPETSCEVMNKFLDRATITETIGSKLGLF